MTEMEQSQGRSRMLSTVFDEDRIPADVTVRFAGEGSETPAFVELDVLDDVDAIGIGVGWHGLSKLN